MEKNKEKRTKYMFFQGLNEEKGRFREFFYAFEEEEICINLDVINTKNYVLRNLNTWKDTKKTHLLAIIIMLDGRKKNYRKEMHEIVHENCVRPGYKISF